MRLARPSTIIQKSCLCGTVNYYVIHSSSPKRSAYSNSHTLQRLYRHTSPETPHRVRKSSIETRNARINNPTHPAPNSKNSNSEYKKSPTCAYNKMFVDHIRLGTIWRRATSRTTRKHNADSSNSNGRVRGWTFERRHTIENSNITGRRSTMKNRREVAEQQEVEQARDREKERKRGDRHAARQVTNKHGKGPARAAQHKNKKKKAEDAHVSHANTKTRNRTKTSFVTFQSTRDTQARTKDKRERERARGSATRTRTRGWDRRRDTKIDTVEIHTARGGGCKT